MFLRPDKIRMLNEYAEEDPYAVSGNINKPFHRQRVEQTIDLLVHSVAGGSESVNILDVAFGEGHISDAICRAFSTAEIHAFDASLSAILSACGRYKELPLPWRMPTILHMHQIILTSLYATIFWSMFQILYKC